MFLPWYVCISNNFSSDAKATSPQIILRGLHVSRNQTRFPSVSDKNKQIIRKHRVVNNLEEQKSCEKEKPRIQDSFISGLIYQYKEYSLPFATFKHYAVFLYSLFPVSSLMCYRQHYHLMCRDFDILKCVFFSF